MKKNKRDRRNEKVGGLSGINSRFFGASEQMFWKNVLEEMLWARNEEERLTFLLKNKLWEQAISENKLSEEDMKTYNDNQYFLNQRERDKWYELEKDQKGWTFLNKLGQQSVNYNKVEMNKLKMFLEYLSKRSVSEANINQMAKNLLITSQGYSPIYVQIPDISINPNDTTQEKESKIKDYLKALNSDKDYAKIEFKRVKSKIEEDGGMVLYVQQQGRKMSRVYNEIDENNEKIKLLEQRVGTTTGHPKTVMIIDKPHSLARKHKPKEGAYPILDMVKVKEGVLYQR